jgi:hypothetical protein
MNKIFGIGLSKTGTTSLHIALGILGYQSIHHPITIEEIEKHKAATDITVSCRFEELDKLYQNSKFILTVRDIQEWLKSCEFHFSKKMPLEKILQLSQNRREVKIDVRQKLYGTLSFDQALFEQAYQRHRYRVKNYFASRQKDLLIVDICAGDGWDKLCPFLGHPTLNVPFPHANQKMINPQNGQERSP